MTYFVSCILNKCSIDMLLLGCLIVGCLEAEMKSCVWDIDQPCFADDVMLFYLLDLSKTFDKQNQVKTLIRRLWTQMWRWSLKKALIIWKVLLNILKTIDGRCVQGNVLNPRDKAKSSQNPKLENDFKFSNILFECSTWRRHWGAASSWHSKSFPAWAFFWYFQEASKTREAG